MLSGVNTRMNGVLGMSLLQRIWYLANDAKYSIHARHQLSAQHDQRQKKAGFANIRDTYRGTADFLVLVCNEIAAFGIAWVFPRYTS